LYKIKLIILIIDLKNKLNFKMIKNGFTFILKKYKLIKISVFCLCRKFKKFQLNPYESLLAKLKNHFLTSAHGKNVREKFPDTLDDTKIANKKLD
jgi:hypothetical protein